MKLNSFEKFVIQMIKDTWRVMLAMVLLVGFLLWGIYCLIDQMIQ